MGIDTRTQLKYEPKLKKDKTTQNKADKQNTKKHYITSAYAFTAKETVVKTDLFSLSNINDLVNNQFYFKHYFTLSVLNGSILQ